MQVNKRIINNNNISFGLKIVNNENFRKLCCLQSKKGKTCNEINDTYIRIGKLQEDSLNLEFLDYEEKKTEVFGTSAYCKLRIFGTMKKSGTNEVCKIDKTTEYKDIVSSEYFLYNRVKYLINCEQKRIDTTETD